MTNIPLNPQPDAQPPVDVAQSTLEISNLWGEAAKAAEEARVRDSLVGRAAGHIMSGIDDLIAKSGVRFTGFGTGQHHNDKW